MITATANMKSETAFATTRLPMRFLSNQTVTDLGGSRDRPPLSSRNSSKGALVQEAHVVFQAISKGMAVAEARAAIRDGALLQSASYETRQRILDSLTHRYFWAGADWSVRALAQASQAGAKSPSFVSLAYLYYALRDRLTFEFVVGPIWEKWRNRSTAVTQGDFQRFLEGQEDREPQIKKWRESTRVKLGQSILAGLRDFGLLRGVQRKQIQKPTIAPETTFHLLCILLAEGLDGRSIVEARDWRLFLWSEAEVAQALGELSQKRWIRFERSGRTAMLELIRQPGEQP
jgi:hypothetical protein